jgi:hypothetical protein
MEEAAVSIGGDLSDLSELEQLTPAPAVAAKANVSSRVECEIGICVACVVSDCIMHRRGTSPRIEGIVAIPAETKHVTSTHRTFL